MGVKCKKGRLLDKVDNITPSRDLFDTPILAGLRRLRIRAYDDDATTS